MTDLESAHHKDSKTLPKGSFWSNSVWNIMLDIGCHLKNWLLFIIDPWLQPQISQLILHQIQRSGSVLESSWQADFKTDPDLWIWWRIDWDIQGWRQGSISKKSVKSCREVDSQFLK